MAEDLVMADLTPYEVYAVHYAHNANVLGVGAGDESRKAMARVAPKVQVAVMKPGDTQLIAT